MLDEEAYHQVIPALLQVSSGLLSVQLAMAGVAVFLLILISAFVSGAEAAFFALSPDEINTMRNRKARNSMAAIRLVQAPERLLTTVLVANSLINMAIILTADVMIRRWTSVGSSGWLFILEVTAISSVIVLFGEILPKAFAIRSSLQMVRLMALPVSFLEIILRPFTGLFIRSAGFINSRFNHGSRNLSMHDLSSALDLTKEEMVEEKDILKGIVKFGNIGVKEIMTARVDVVGVSIKTRFRQLIKLVVESAYSRIPVYVQDLDHIKGILYVKDLLPHLEKPDGFSWQYLIRPPYFVPEIKKINELLKEFQTSKIHMAVVLDEYGGTSGIITLEDILEEIVGEITDESDGNEAFYVRQDEHNYLFEAKVLLNDFFKIINMNEKLISEVKGEAETLAGLILEIRKELPGKNEVIEYKNFRFTIKSVDQRRIRQVQVTILNKEEGND